VSIETGKFGEKKALKMLKPVADCGRKVGQAEVEALPDVVVRLRRDPAQRGREAGQILGIAYDQSERRELQDLWIFRLFLRGKMRRVFRVGPG
jgi:hypothetical protein